MDIRIAGKDIAGMGGNGLLGYRQRKNIDPERFIGYLNARVLCETLSIKPFIHVGGVDVGAIVSEFNGAPHVRRTVGEVIVRSREGGTLLYQDMEFDLRQGLLMRKLPFPGSAVSAYGAFGEIPALRITVHTSSDGHPARVRRSDTLYEGFLRRIMSKRQPAPDHLSRLFPTEELLDHSLDGRWYLER